MYRAKFMVTTAMALMLGLGGNAMAAGSGDQQSGTTMQPGTTGAMQSGSASVQQWQSRADQVIGQQVVTPQGEEVGDVEDLVVNPSNQKVHAVIGIGGFLGMGEKQVAVPVDQLQMQGEQLVMSQPRAELEQMAEYNGQWQSIRQGQGATPGAGTTPGTGGTPGGGMQGTDPGTGAPGGAGGAGGSGSGQ